MKFQGEYMDSEVYEVSISPVTQDISLIRPCLLPLLSKTPQAYVKINLCVHDKPNLTIIIVRVCNSEIANMYARSNTRTLCYFCTKS